MAQLVIFAVSAVLGALISIAGVMSGEIPAYPTRRSLRRDRQPLLFWVLVACLITFTISITWLAVDTFCIVASGRGRP